MVGTSSISGIFVIALLSVFLLVISGVLTMIIPVFSGVNNQTSHALGVNGTAIDTATTDNLAAQMTTTRNIFGFLGFLGVGIVLAQQFGIKMDLSQMFKGGI